MCFVVLCFSCFRVCSLLLCVHLLERADLLALVGDVYCILLLSHVASRVKCGTCVYRFLIFAVFLIFKRIQNNFVSCTSIEVKESEILTNFSDLSTNV